MGNTRALPAERVTGKTPRRWQLSEMMCQQRVWSPSDGTWHEAQARPHRRHATTRGHTPTPSPTSSSYPSPTGKRRLAAIHRSLVVTSVAGTTGRIHSHLQPDVSQSTLLFRGEDASQELSNHGRNWKTDVHSQAGGPIGRGRSGRSDCGPLVKDQALRHTPWHYLDNSTRTLVVFPSTKDRIPDIPLAARLCVTGANPRSPGAKRRSRPRQSIHCQKRSVIGARHWNTPPWSTVNPHRPGSAPRSSGIAGIPVRDQLSPIYTRHQLAFAPRASPCRAGNPSTGDPVCPRSQTQRNHQVAKSPSVA